MCKTNGAAWRNSVMVDFYPGPRSPRGTTARVLARGSFRDALSTCDCFTKTKTSKKIAAAAHPYIHRDWRAPLLASGSCMTLDPDNDYVYKDGFEFPLSLRRS